jgi:hypothetical protein
VSRYRRDIHKASTAVRHAAKKWDEATCVIYSIYEEYDGKFMPSRISHALKVADGTQAAARLVMSAQGVHRMNLKVQRRNAKMIRNGFAPALMDGAL